MCKVVFTQVNPLKQTQNKRLCDGSLCKSVKRVEMSVVGTNKRDNSFNNKQNCTMRPCDLNKQF